MEVLFTRIVRQGNPIQLLDVNKLLESRMDLQPIPDRTMPHPFKKGEVVHASGAGKANYLEANKPVGNLSLEEGEVITTGIPRSACEELAMFLDAVVLDTDLS